MSAAHGLPIVVTMGEPAGIGGDIVLAAWTRARARLPLFYLNDCPRRLAALARRLGLDVPIVTIARPEAAAEAWTRGLPVHAIADLGEVTPGTPSVHHADAVIAALADAVDMVQAKRAAALVTNPIHKKVLMDAHFPHPGHTEYLGARSQARPVMMLVCPGLRVVPVTIHLALHAAIAALRREDIVAAGRIVQDALRRDFAIEAPRLALAGLNPHAGEEGAFGREEIDIIAPAVADLVAAGIDVSGPWPADSLFHAEARARTDAVICMYHDQALIPLKTIDFWGGVNVTLGLSFVRTSPDHGTAFDLAGTGKANPASLIAALDLARQMARNRDRTVSA